MSHIGRAIVGDDHDIVEKDKHEGKSDPNYILWTLPLSVRPSN